MHLRQARIEKKSSRRVRYSSRYDPSASLAAQAILDFSPTRLSAAIQKETTDGVLNLLRNSKCLTYEITRIIVHALGQLTPDDYITCILRQQGKFDERETDCHRRVCVMCLPHIDMEGPLGGAFNSVQNILNYSLHLQYREITVWCFRQGIDRDFFYELVRFSYRKEVPKAAPRQLIDFVCHVFPVTKNNNDDCIWSVLYSLSVIPFLSAASAAIISHADFVSCRTMTFLLSVVRSYLLTVCRDFVWSRQSLTRLHFYPDSELPFHRGPGTVQTSCLFHTLTSKEMETALRQSEPPTGLVDFVSRLEAWCAYDSQICDVLAQPFINVQMILLRNRWSVQGHHLFPDAFKKSVPTVIFLLRRWNVPDDLMTRILVHIAGGIG